MRKAMVSRFSKNFLGCPIREFADSGSYVFRSFCDKKEVDRLRARYLTQSTDALESNDGNVMVPFFDVVFISRFYQSAAWKMLSAYGQAVYGTEPVLQIYPSLILTKPTFTQEEFSGRKHNVPALFHTDYPTELTVHVPLTNITGDTTHTRFCAKSHRSLKVRPQSTYAPTMADQFNQVNLFANAGDLIAVDVTGIHRADIVRDSIRVMIQLKFTSPRYVLNGLDWSRRSIQARESKAFTNNSLVFEEDLRNSLIFENARMIDRALAVSFINNY